jgi:hypothetical protein
MSAPQSEDELKFHVLPQLVLNGDVEGVQQILVMYNTITPYNSGIKKNGGLIRLIDLVCKPYGRTVHVPNRDAFLKLFVANYDITQYDALEIPMCIQLTIHRMLIESRDPRIMRILFNNRPQGNAIEYITTSFIPGLLNENRYDILDILLRYLKENNIPIDMNNIVFSPYYGNGAPTVNALEYAFDRDDYNTAAYLLYLSPYPMESRGHSSHNIKYSIYALFERTMDPSVLMKIDADVERYPWDTWRNHVDLVKMELIPYLFGKCEEIAKIDVLLDYFKIDILEVVEIDTDTRMSLLEYAVNYACENIALHLLYKLNGPIPEYVPQPYINAIQREKNIIGNENVAMTGFNRRIKNLPPNVKKYVIGPYLHGRRGRRTRRTRK